MLQISRPLQKQLQPLQGTEVVFSALSGPALAGLKHMLTFLGGRVRPLVTSSTTVFAAADLSLQTTNMSYAIEHGVKVQSYYDFRIGVRGL